MQGKGCQASSVCKTEAHAYVWIYPRVVRDYVQTRSDCVRRVSENLNQRVGSQNGKQCSPSVRGGEQTGLVGFN